MFSRFKKSQGPVPDPVTLNSPAEEQSLEQEKVKAIEATGIDVDESIQQLKKFKKLHQWV